MPAGLLEGIMDLRFILILGLCVLCAFILTGCSNTSSAPVPPASGNATQATSADAAHAPPASSKPAFVRPTLNVQQGNYFSYAMPTGWTASETANGVDMISPDGKLIAS